MRKYSALLLSIMAYFAGGPASADVVRYVGTGVGCNNATIQSAINAANNANGTTYIRITRTLTYTNQQLYIASKNVVLTGGYADCNQTVEDGGHTTLGGINGTAGAVITVSGTTTFVGIYKLDINNNRNTNVGAGAGFGGGIAVRGGPHTLVGLGDNSINGNQANFGGGLYVNNEFSNNANDVNVLIGANVFISNNRGVNAGGGVACVDAVVRMNYPNSSIIGNSTAATVGAPGGGIRAEGCYLAIASSVFGLGSIAFNSAGGDGGGISASASTIDLFTSDPSNPTLLSSNIANGVGGAIVVDANSRVTGWDVIIEGNTGRGGGGAVAMRETTDDGIDASFTMRGDLLNAPAGAVLCTTSLRCNRLSFNQAAAVDGSQRGGAAIFATSVGNQDIDNFAAVNYSLYGTEVFSNSGNTLITASGDFASGYLSGSALFGNTANVVLIDLNSQTSSFFDMYSSTIAGNTAGGLRSIQRDFNVGLKFKRSLHWQPGKTITNGPGVLTNDIDYAIANDLSNVSPSIRNLQVADPLFVDPSANDFHLQLGSVAVDYATTIAGDNYSADHLPRVVDLSDVTNEFGPRDVGAYERQNPFTGDAIFSNGFDL